MPMTEAIIEPTFDLNTYLSACRRDIEAALEHHLPPVTAQPHTVPAAVGSRVGGPGSPSRFS